MSTGTIGGYYANAGAVTGGANFTSLDHVQIYGGSEHESAHEKLVRSVAKGLSNVMKVQGINPNEADLGKLCQAIKKSVTAISNNKKFSASRHDGVTTKLANVLNDAYGSNILNVDQDPAVLCNQILELVSSLCMGLHGEYASVKGEVKRALKNLQDLRVLLDRTYQDTLNRIDGSDDIKLKAHLRSLKKVHELLRDETNRQIAILQNLFKTVVEPTDASVHAILDNNKDLNKIVKRLKSTSPGDKRYSLKLMQGLTGLGNIAGLTQDVSAALKTIGMSISQYRDAKSLKEIEAAASKLMKTNVDMNNPNMDAVALFSRAVEILREAEYYRSDISKSLKTGGKIVGGRYKGLNKRIKKRRKLRNSVFRGFNAEMAREFDTMVDQLDRFSKALSTNTVITEELDSLISALGNIPDIGQRNIYYSLAGYIDDVRARSRREFIVNQFNYSVSSINRLLKMDVYKNQHALLKELHDNILRVLNIIKQFKGYFSSGWKVSTKIGSGEPDAPTAAEEKAGMKQGEAIQGEEAANTVGPELAKSEELFNNGLEQSDVEGGALDGKALPEVTKSAYRLKEVLGHMRAYYNLAKTRYSLSQAVNVVNEAAEDYTVILGDGIGKKLEALTNQHMGNDPKSTKSTIERAKSAKVWGPESSKVAGDLQSFNRDMFEAKRDMYRTIEAIEMYLMAFSDAISKHPEEIRDLKSILDGIDLIGKWATNSTGQRLADVFDSFPSGFDGTGAAIKPEIVKETGDHYYNKLSDAIAKKVPGSLPGIPFLPIDIAEANAAKKKADSAVRSMGVLKNLVNAFFAIGKKFNGKELRKETHMSSKQIYENLRKYLWISAFVSGISPKNAGGGATDTFVDVPNSNLAGVMPVGPSLTLAGGLRIGKAAALYTGAPGPYVDSVENAVKNMTLVTMDGFVDEPELRLMSTFQHTDELFIMAIKCLASKPLTVVGLYNIFNKPQYQRRDMGPARMVLGGNTYPKVDEKLTALYIRLPLMAEFYRELFNFEGFTGEYAISMVPEVDGLFSNFVELMFNQTRHVQRGFYSESQVREIVEAINSIYNRFDSKKETVVTDIINEFVAEINRRYGIVERSDRKDYRDERRIMRGHDSDYMNLEIIDDDYPILEGEDEPDFRRPAPSDAYYGITTRNYQTDAEFDMGEKKVINELRRKIDSMLYRQEISNGQGEDYQFNASIYQAQRELRSSGDDKERFNIILGAVQGVGKYLRHGGIKTIAFGETVVNGLAMLGAIYSQLVAYRKATLAMNAGGLEQDVTRVLSQATTQAVTPGKAYLATALEKLDETRNPRYSDTDANNVLNNCLGAMAGNIEVDASGKFGAGCSGVFASLAGVQAAAFSQDILGTSATAALDALFAGLESANIVAHLHELLFAQDTDLNKMVRIRVADGENNEGTLIIDHSNLKSHVEKLFRCVKDATNKFRGSVPEEDLRHYERDENSGLYFLEEKLMDELVKGGDLENERPISLDQIDTAIADTMDVLKRRGNPANWDAFLDDEILGLTGNIALGTFAGSSGVLAVLNDQPRVAGGPRLPPGGITAPSGPTVNYPDAADSPYNTASDFSARKSLFFLFNELLFKYINMSFDPAAQKVYRRCLDNIAGGVFSDSVTNPVDNSFIDDLANNYNAAQANMASRVMTSTNAHLLRRLMNGTTSQARPAYIVQELADVPKHMRDRYRANYPFVIKCADTLIRRCELLKDMKSSGLQFGAAATARERVAILDKISQGLFALRNSAVEVLKEIDDQPKFMEVTEGAIDYHKGLHGDLPIMPLSALTCLLTNTGVVGQAFGENVLLPFSTQGKTSFKFRYGTRQTLGRPESNASLEHMPWVKQMMQQYNGVSEPKCQLDEGYMNEFAQTYVELMRYFTDSRHMRSKMYNANVWPANVDVIGNQPENGIYSEAGKKIRSVYFVQDYTMFTDVISLVESTFNENKRMKLAQAVTTQSLATSRRDVAVRNMLDMSIVPINIRALMQGVVLTNVYNYSYTWDQIVMQTFGYHPSSPLAIDTDSVPASALMNPKDVFVRLLIQPYQALDMGSYYMSLPIIMSGLLGLKMGRPKFLGDQFYNMALLGELYPNINSYLSYNGQQTWHTNDGLRQNLGYGIGPGPARAANAMARTAVTDANMAQIVNAIVGTIPAPGAPAGQVVARVIGLINNKAVPALPAAAEPKAVEIAEVLSDLRANPKTDVEIKSKMDKLEIDVGGRRLYRTVKNLIPAAGRANMSRRSGPGAAAGLFRGEFLTFIKHGAKKHGAQVAEVKIGPAARQAVKVIGKLRFDTKFARNISFIVMVQRVLRLVLSDSLSWDKRVISGTTITDDTFTEAVADDSSYDQYERSLNRSRYNMDMN